MKQPDNRHDGLYVRTFLLRLCGPLCEIRFGDSHLTHTEVVNLIWHVTQQ